MCSNNESPRTSVPSKIKEVRVLLITCLDNERMGHQEVVVRGSCGHRAPRDSDRGRFDAAPRGAVDESPGS